MKKFIDIKTMDIEAIATIVEAEGINYAITDKILAEEIEDAELRKLWGQAYEKLSEVEEITEKINAILEEVDQ